MKQLVHSSGRGTLRVIDIPVPTPGPTQYLVRTTRSLISSGTERAIRSNADRSLVAKARARPDLVRQVLRRAREDGIRETVRAVQDRLADELPLGYSACGVVVEAGLYTPGLPPGTRVATASAGHAEFQLVPGLLAVPVPDGVDDESAAFSAVGAIAMHGLRQASVRTGETVLVVGLGLVGQITARMAAATGMRVIGVDTDAARVTLLDDLLEGSGAGIVERGDTTAQVLALTEGAGADAAIICASTSSSAPVAAASQRVRDRGTIVIVGDVGLDLDRGSFYDRELQLKFARSYGPGRYDPTYENLGVDYPSGYVRWPAGKNMAAFLDMVATQRLFVSDLASRSFDLSAADAAYASIAGEPDVIAVQFHYEQRPHAATAIHVRAPGATSARGAPHAVGLIGAGAFASSVLVPSMTKSGWTDLRSVHSSRGISARRLAERHGFLTLATSETRLIEDPAVSVVFIATPHASHARLVETALQHHKPVFVEKPLAISDDELDGVRAAQQASGLPVWVGFNRRYAPATLAVQERLREAGTGPLCVSYRVNAGRLPESHWYADRREGGRLIGEVCHFIDLAGWLVGAPATSVTALSGGRDPARLNEDYSVTVRYEDGSLASIVYAVSGYSGTPKERLEVLGRGHTFLIDDFRQVAYDGDVEKAAAQDKGHRANLERFHAVVAGEVDGAPDLAASLQTSALALGAVRSISTGAEVHVR